MQTIPSFVYLMPVVMLFGISDAPGVIVTCLFVITPLIRLTNLGIREVREDLVEAARAFDADEMPTLFGTQLPLARPISLAGLNQTVPLSLSMAVVASMISVVGLGPLVFEGVGRFDFTFAAVGGLGTVMVAVFWWIDTRRRLVPHASSAATGRVELWISYVCMIPSYLFRSR